MALGQTDEAADGTARFSLRVPPASGDAAKAVAAIGESKAQSGLVLIGDAQGSRKASITIADGKGILSLYNGDDKPILTFGEAIGNAGGSLVIGDVNSEPKVKMGSNGERYGAVLALPVGVPYVPRSGLPGSYFLGCAGGRACVPF